MEGICFYNSNKAWGGGEKWHFDIGTRLHQKGHHVIFFVHPHSVLKEKLSTSGIPVFTVSTSNLSFLNPFKRRKVKSVLKREGIQTIILNLSSDVKLAGPAAAGAGVKNIIYRRGLAKPVKNSVLNRYLFQRVLTHLICNSQETKKMVFKNNADLMPSERVSIIYNGIDLQTIRSGGAPMFAKPRENILYLGNLGRLVDQKGQRHLIELASLLRDKGVDFHLFIGGAGPLEKELKRYANELNVSAHITFAGFISDAHAFMQSLDIFILPSYWEGFGYVLVEAMVNSVPVVAFNITSNPEIVDDQTTGILCRPGDTEALLTQTMKLIQNPKLRTEMGQAGRERVLARFTMERTVQEVEQLLERLS
jgi:glycosyltransferase involved in cell wall biosynthesis